jgi:GNAT superfamily N-acetyltransferase
MKIQKRELKESDRDFVFSSWLFSFKGASPFAKRIRGKDFYKNHQKVIENIIERPTLMTCVACLEDDPDVILGFIIWEQDQGTVSVHYIFVKEIYRGNGVGAFLWEEIPKKEVIYASHLTYPVVKFFNQNESLHYDPYRMVKL